MPTLTLAQESLLRQMTNEGLALIHGRFAYDPHYYLVDGTTLANDTRRLVHRATAEDLITDHPDSIAYCHRTSTSLREVYRAK